MGFLILSAVIVSWISFINYETEKIPLDYKIILEQEGEDQLLESIDGVISEPFIIKGIFTQHVESTEQNILMINSVVSDKNIYTGEVVFESSQLFLVDANTRKYHENENYFIFPSNVKKQNYELLHPIVAVPATFVFEETRIIDGLEVYVFSCEILEQNISDFFTHFPQKKIFYDGRCMAIIEPITGLEIDFELQWDNYIVENGVRGKQVEFGYKKNTLDTVTILIQTAKNLKELYNIYKIIIPLIIGIIGSSILVIILLLNRNKIQTKNIINMQNELLKSERFSAIGELSARIAHDIRNPLSIIQASLDLFEYLKDDPEKFDKLLKRNSRAVDRITRQIDDVMDFVRHSKLHVEKIRLKEMFDSLVLEINDIDKIKINLPKNDLEISGDKGKLFALFSNLILNAFQAIEDDGIITISISQLNDTVQIDIEDNGKGVLEKDLEKIFEPLFTTKQEGTGLGLASCKKIVESHGGSISVKNNPTTFTVILPLVCNPVN